jgi:MSHA biogenesis protein MshQ
MALVAGLAIGAGCQFAVNGLGGPDGVSDDLGAGGGMDLSGGEMDLAMGGSTDLAPARLRKLIRIDPTAINSTLTDFPVWIDLTDSDVAAHAQPDARDIHFMAADSATPLDYQIQSWQSPRLQAWVRVPTLSASAATLIYIYYGDPATAVAANPAGVFQSGFAAVWHLDDAAPATAVADATGTHPGNPSLNTATSATAQLGRGLAFTGSTDSISFQNPLTGSTAHTVSVWVNQPTVNHTSPIVVMGSAMQDESRFFYAHHTSPAVAIGYYSDDWLSSADIDGAGWTLLHWVFEGANGKNHLYRNGVEISGSPMTISNVSTTGTTGMIGHAPEPTYGNNMRLEGSIDELRIATVARTADWIAAEYANQSAPTLFYTVGAEEPVP